MFSVDQSSLSVSFFIPRSDWLRFIAAPRREMWRCAADSVGRANLLELSSEDMRPLPRPVTGVSENLRFRETAGVPGGEGLRK